MAGPRPLAAALARAADGVRKVKAQPAPGTYNALFPALARDLADHLDRACPDGGFPADPDFFKKKLRPWMEVDPPGVPACVPEDCPPGTIIALIRDFETVCRGIAQLAIGCNPS